MTSLGEILTPEPFRSLIRREKERPKLERARAIIEALREQQTGERSPFLEDERFNRILAGEFDEGGQPGDPRSRVPEVSSPEDALNELYRTLGEGRNFERFAGMAQGMANKESLKRGIEALAPALANALGVSPEDITPEAIDTILGIAGTLQRQQAGGQGELIRVNEDGSVDIVRGTEAIFEKAQASRSGQERAKETAAARARRRGGINLFGQLEEALRTTNEIEAGSLPAGVAGRVIAGIQSAAEQLTSVGVSLIDDEGTRVQIKDALRMFEPDEFPYIAGLSSAEKVQALNLAFVRAAALSQDDEISREELRASLQSNEGIFSGSVAQRKAAIRQAARDILRFNRADAGEFGDEFLIRIGQVAPELAAFLDEEDVQREERKGGAGDQADDLQDRINRGEVIDFGELKRLRGGE